MTFADSGTSATFAIDGVSVQIVQEARLPNDLPDSRFEPGIYNHPRWLSAIDEIRAGGTCYFVARTTEGGRILGILPAYWGDHTERGFYSPYGKYLETVLPNIESASVEPALIVGTRAGYSCEFLIDRSLPEVQRVQLLTALLTCAGKLGHQLGLASLTAMYVEETECNLARRAFGDGTLEFETAESARMGAPSSFEDYAVGLGSKRGREVRREQRVFAQSGYGVTVTSGTHPALPRLLALTEARYGHEANELTERREAEIFDEKLQGMLLSFVLEIENEIIGVATAIRSGSTLSLRSLGLDYSRLRDSFEYFNLAFYAPISWCARQTITRIDWGIGSLEAKQRRGAELEKTHGFLRPL